MSNAKKLSMGVMRTRYNLWRVSCNCSDPSCDVTIDVDEDRAGMEIDADELAVNILFYKKLRHLTNKNWNRWVGWIPNLWWKLKAVYKILVKGYIEVEECIMIDSGEHLDGFMEALSQAKVVADKRKEEYHRRLEEVRVGKK